MRFLRLAASDLLREPGDPFILPFGVDLGVSTEDPLVAVSEGVAHGAAGGVISVSEALSAEWRMHLQRAEGLWLLPYLDRIAAGERIDESELVAEFRARHGRDPEAYEWDVPWR